MTSDDDKAAIGKRLTGHTDPQDPDGLLTVDGQGTRGGGDGGGAGDADDGSEAGREVASDEYPEIPTRHEATAHDRNNRPL